MKFQGMKCKVDRLLKLNREDVITFEIIVSEPVVVKEHLIKNDDGKMKVEPCIGEKCDYCATYRVLAKKAIMEAREFIAHKRYFLPVIVEKNDCGIDPGKYVFRFGNQIYKAYMQLLICADQYKFNPDKKLLFTHRVKMKDTWPDYNFCLFTFGKQTKTVDRLDRDSGNRIFFA
jgi:hypothetical protein